VCTDFLKTLGSNRNIAEWRERPKISEYRIVYVPDSVFTSWVQRKRGRQFCSLYPAEIHATLQQSRKCLWALWVRGKLLEGQKK